MKLTPYERVIAWRLAEGRSVSRDEIFTALWGDRGDGGPLNADVVVRVLIYRIRIALSGFGLDVGTPSRFQGWAVPLHQIPALRAVLAEEIARNVPSGRLRNRKSAPASPKVLMQSRATLLNQKLASSSAGQNL